MRHKLGALDRGESGGVRVFLPCGYFGWFFSRKRSAPHPLLGRGWFGLESHVPREVLLHISPRVLRLGAVGTGFCCLAVFCDPGKLFPLPKPQFPRVHSVGTSPHLLSGSNGGGQREKLWPEAQQVFRECFYNILTHCQLGSPREDTGGEM